jgi:hypothetical protein
LHAQTLGQDLSSFGRINQDDVKRRHFEGTIGGTPPPLKKSGEKFCWVARASSNRSNPSF